MEALPRHRYRNDHHQSWKVNWLHDAGIREQSLKTHQKGIIYERHFKIIIIIIAAFSNIPATLD